MRRRECASRRLSSPPNSEDSGCTEKAGTRCGLWNNPQLDRIEIDLSVIPVVDQGLDFLGWPISRESAGEDLQPRRRAGYGRGARMTRRDDGATAGMQLNHNETSRAASAARAIDSALRGPLLREHSVLLGFLACQLLRRGS